MGSPKLKSGCEQMPTISQNYLGWRVINFDCCVEFASARARQLYAKRFHAELVVSHVVFVMQCVGVVEWIGQFDSCLKRFESCETSICLKGMLLRVRSYQKFIHFDSQFDFSKNW